jgi:glycosyltransferase involved in cell wall biosynthesis
MRILIITPYYLPGFKAGGPVRSVANLVDWLGAEISFYIIAGDRDLGDEQPYADIGPSAWQRVGKASIAYVPMSRLGPLRLRNLINEAGCNALYLNSFFHPRVYALPLALKRCGLIPQLPVIVAPRGGFSPGALGIRPWKKRPYLLAAHLLAKGTNILWHAASELEADHIRGVIGPAARIVIAPNVCSVDDHSVPRLAPKRSGQLRLVFLSRISPKKNLLGAIKLLRRLLGQISLDIYGPISDPAYWRECQEEVSRLPSHVLVAYRGMVPPAEVMATLAQYDAMLLPTLGENFGHAIVESLVAGCPVVISDRTPWRNLPASGVGWDLSLESPHDFEQVLTALIAMDDSSHRTVRDNARVYGNRILSNHNAVEQSRQLFQRALDLASGRPLLAHRRAA